MHLLVVVVFILGYFGITLEHSIKINKAATGLLTAVICWSIIVLSDPDKSVVISELSHHLSSIGEIIFFLLGAMTIVELIDAHDGFEKITEKIKSTNKTKLIWTIAIVTFFLSAVLDNLTTTIVMISILSKLIHDQKTKWLLLGLVIISSNAGGAWSPIGDVTTTMLWIGGQITPLNIVKQTFLPSLICMILPTLIINYSIKGNIELKPQVDTNQNFTTNSFERNLVFYMGICGLLFVPVFKTVTHLPPYMGMFFSLGVMWVLTELMHGGKDDEEKGILSVNHALKKIDTPSILFFFGILLSIGSLEYIEVLPEIAQKLDEVIGNINIVAISIGFLSAIFDNVPLVAALQRMYSLDVYPPDHYFWELLAYTAGTGGSCLIIGSAAGVAVMGMEKIDFFWYLKKISWISAIGFLAGAGVFILMHDI
ncbi:MAG: sodium:proton antiporter NhaD [Flammeovirgaceae bacterium]|jgi:Na+/H+ antiporter NhaD/arsenite permease-like protein|nr:sodium:proton antiporter NhaD [Flammeovirgaceae bacterium]|tara:strand:+ start:31844 stop:33118 length:1275 start_codon:yes stop_codon:yes gene_type:complete